MTDKDSFYAVPVHQELFLNSHLQQSLVIGLPIWKTSVPDMKIIIKKIIFRQ